MIFFYGTCLSPTKLTNDTKKKNSTRNRRDYKTLHRRSIYFPTFFDNKISRYEHATSCKNNFKEESIPLDEHSRIFLEYLIARIEDKGAESRGEKVARTGTTGWKFRRLDANSNSYAAR